MTDMDKTLKYWNSVKNKQPLSFKEFSRTFKVYKPKYKWQSKMPLWLLKWFVKPITLYNCFPKAIDSICDENGNLSYNITMNYKNN